MPSQVIMAESGLVEGGGRAVGGGGGSGEGGRESVGELRREEGEG